MKSFAASLGFSETLKSIEREEAMEEKRKIDRFDTAAQPRGILKPKKTPPSGSKMRGVVEDGVEDDERRTDLSVSLLNTTMTPPTDDKSSAKARSISFGTTTEAKEPRKSVSPKPASTLRSGINDSAKKKLSFGADVKKKSISGTGGISFSPSTISQKTTSSVSSAGGVSDADLEAERLAADMAKLVAGGVGGRGGGSVDLGRRKKAGFSSISLVSRATRGLKRR